MAPARRVLVTGGAGFLGSHLCDLLLREGAEHVVCLDNFCSGRRSNVAHLVDDSRFTLVAHDVVDPFPADVLRLVEGVDQIYHLACPASPVFYQHDALHTIRTCVVGSMQIFELGRSLGATVLVASTSEVYGNPSEHPQREAYHGDVNPIGVRACYDEGKRVMETLAFDYLRTHGLQVRVARIFNSYGPRMNMLDGRVTSNFIVQAIKGQQITLYGDGSQTRSFCFCMDTVAGLHALMNNDKGHPGPINIGMPSETTIQQFAATVVRLVGVEAAELVMHPLPSDDPCKRLPCIERARRVLGWEPRVQLEEGLLATIAYFRVELQRQEAEGSSADEELNCARLATMARREEQERQYRALDAGPG